MKEVNLSLRLVQQWAHVCSPLLVRAHSPTYIRPLIERHCFDDYAKIIQLCVTHLRTIKYGELEVARSSRRNTIDFIWEGVGGSHGLSNGNLVMRNLYE